MPNWVTNDLEIHGEPADIKNFLEHMGTENDGFSFEKIIPSPCKEWNRQWCVDNWDTKWDACEVETIQASHVAVSYRFFTAWSPPEKVITALKTQWPSLNVSGSYVCEGNEFCGRFE